MLDPPGRRGGRRLRPYLWALATVTACTLACWPMAGRFDNSNLIMVYLLGVTFVAARHDRAPSVLAALLGVAAFDFFFVPPHLTFAVSDTQYLITFSVMLVVSLLISTLAVRVKAQAADAEQARLAAETERLRSTLLSSVSHDFRTPLAAITGAASGLLGDASLGPEARADLARTVYEEAVRLNRIVINLLDMTRLESGALRLDKQWHSLEELVGAAVGRIERSLDGRRLRISLPPELPLLSADAVLIEQLLFNLLENGVKHTPAGASLEIAAARRNGDVEVSVANDGPPLPAGEEARIFEKFFHRGAQAGGGVGLGLAICRAIVQAHVGHIWAENRPSGGVVFRFTLPMGGTPPAPPQESGDEPV